MTSRFWMSLLVAVLVAALVFVVTRRVFGFGLLLLPVFFAWGGGGRKR